MTATRKTASARKASKDPQEQSAAAPSPFPPIADYAFLSNCHTGALVAPDGAIDWLCVPCFDAPSVFGSLLDREAGSFRFGPFGINHPTTRIYEPGTNVLATTWKSPSAWILVRDALTIGPRDHEDKITPHTRPPADADADHLLVRTVLCLEGRVEVELVCEPAFDYGRVPAKWSAVDGDRHVADASGAEQTIRLRSDLALGIEGSRVRARHVLGPGDRAYCALSWAEGLATPQNADEAEARIAATIRYWRDWLGGARIPDHRYRAQIQRSALAIKGLTYMPTGATVAAPTTSLPETPGGERNWDYRYTWMRDATFMLQALHWLHLDWEADEFMQFVADVETTRTARCRSCTASTAAASCPKRRGTTSRATQAHARFASAMPPSVSARTTYSAPSSTQSCSTPAGTSACRAGSGRSSNRRQRAPLVSGVTQTRVSGRPAASRSITCPPS